MEGRQLIRFKSLSYSEFATVKVTVLVGTVPFTIKGHSETGESQTGRGLADHNKNQQTSFWESTAYVTDGSHNFPTSSTASYNKKPLVSCHNKKTRHACGMKHHR